MAFRIPEFNLLCDIWHSSVYPPVGAPDIAGVACQLAWDALADKPITISTSVISLMKIRFPAGTDVRGAISSTGQDTIECPSGSGRFYLTRTVDDVAKGFPNEFRQATAQMTHCPTPLT